MRSSERISRSPREWHDHEAEERRRIAASLLADLRLARESGAEWYRWIADGCRPLSPAQYELVSSDGAKRRRSSRRQR